MINPEIPHFTNAKPLRSLGQAALHVRGGSQGQAVMHRGIQGMGAGFPQAGFRFCTCMKGWHMSRESSIAGKLHQGMGADFAPARFRICAARVAGTRHGNPASQTAAGRKLHQGSPLRFLCRMRWPEVRASEKTISALFGLGRP